MPGAPAVGQGAADASAARPRRRPRQRQRAARGHRVPSGLHGVQRGGDRRGVSTLPLVLGGPDRGLRRVQGRRVAAQQAPAAGRLPLPACRGRGPQRPTRGETPPEAAVHAERAFHDVVLQVVRQPGLLPSRVRERHGRVVASERDPADPAGPALRERDAHSRNGTGRPRRGVERFPERNGVAAGRSRPRPTGAARPGGRSGPTRHTGRVSTVPALRHPNVEVALEQAADATVARQVLDRIIEADAGVADDLVERPTVREALIAVACACRVRCPTRSSPTHRSSGCCATWSYPVRAATPDPAALRRWKRAELLRIAAVDLLGEADLPTVGAAPRRRSGDACLAVAVEIVAPTVPFACGRDGQARRPGAQLRQRRRRAVRPRGRG